MKPVYIINGFLGSGKTEFINFTLDQPYFQSSGKTLLLLCEEGEEEYDPYVLKRSKTIVETIEEEADFTPEKMVELEKKYHPERIIIEYNGMWKFRDLRLPWHWKVEQQITTIDASTFPMYFTNMKSMVSDMIRKSEMIIFNRCDGIEDLNTYMKPVYIINGFLGSGKTEFINFTLDQPYFQSSGKTLLLLCEEGEEEYDPYVLKRSKTIVETIEEEADFTPEKMVELEKKYHPERIIIEYNGMWKFRDLRLPWHWKVEQQITTIDASTFPMYFTNMKSMVSDMIRKSEMIIFNRCDGIEDLNTYKRNVKALNQTAEIIFEDQDGEIDEIMEEDLPYDLKADKIVLDDNTYGIWYLDSLDHVDRYVGKTIEFIGMVMKPEEFPKGYFVPGRMAMTCCAEDMTFLGFACVYDKIDLYQERDWVKVTAVVKKRIFCGL